MLQTLDAASCFLPPGLLLAEGEKTLLDYVAQGRGIGFVIIGLSLIALGMIVAQLLAIRVSRAAPDEHAEALEQFVRANDVRGALAYCENSEHDSVLTRTVGAALGRCARSPFGFLELRSAIEEAGQQQMDRLHRGTEGIGLVAAIAPMLGLLGTVVGMVGAFDTISLTEGPVRPDALAGNISEALITTVLGLIVAIPCTAAYAYLRGRIDQVAAEVGEVIEEIVSPLETASRGQPQVGGQARPRPAAPAQPGSAG
jgi:biopolymer transport protein ExbB